MTNKDFKTVRKAYADTVASAMKQGKREAEPLNFSMRQTEEIKFPSGQSNDRAYQSQNWKPVQTEFEKQIQNQSFSSDFTKKQTEDASWIFSEEGNQKAGKIPSVDYPERDEEEIPDYEFYLDEKNQLNSRPVEKTTYSGLYNTKYYHVSGKTIWANMNDLQGLGYLPNGEIVAGSNVKKIDIDLLKLKLEYMRPGSDKNAIAAEAARLRASTGPGDYSVKEWNSLDDYAIIDVTNTLNTIMLRAEYEAGWRSDTSWIFNAYPHFYNQVKAKGEFDLKSKPEFKNDLYIYNGEVVSRDVLGNILYGYYGKVLNIPDNVLLAGGGYAQIMDNAYKANMEWITTYFDDPRDSKRIKQGIELYNSLHS